MHTNQRHPFLTLEHGFVPVSQLTVGMHVLNADGTVGTVTGRHVVPGTQVMYNLDVAQDHTYTVGVGEWVVHNCAQSLFDPHYEDRVKQAVGDPTVGEANSHSWLGSRPAFDASGNPIDRGWAGPDAVSNQYTSAETWVEAKQTVPGEDVFAKARNVRQLERYRNSGWPFIYYMSSMPSQSTIDTIINAGGRYVIFP